VGEGREHESRVDALCALLFLSKTARETDDNLAFVRNRLLNSEVDVAPLLDLYNHVCKGKRVRDDETNLLCSVLRLSGVVKVERGLLRVRNRINVQVFDRQWVRASLPNAELHRQRRAYRLDILRTAALAAVMLVITGGLAGVALRNARRAATNANRANANEERAKQATETARVAKATMAPRWLRSLRRRPWIEATINGCECTRCASPQLWSWRTASTECGLPGACCAGQPIVPTNGG